MEGTDVNSDHGETPAVGESSATPAAYSLADVARTLQTSVQQIRAWARLLGPGVQDPPFSFQDLVAFRTLHGFKQAGLPYARIRKALQHLRKLLPGIEAPLSCLRLRIEGREILVDRGHQAMTTRGQLLLSLEPERPRTTVLVLAEGASSPAEAEARALARELAEAHVDLGGQLLEAGHPVDARSELERALAFDPAHVHALTCLARVFDALGCPVKAEEYRKRAKTQDPPRPEARGPR
jgi:DNA-binding transcriptional MerR regulator